MTDPLSRLDRPGLDTWLARALHARGLLELALLQELVAEARCARAQSGSPATLAQSIVQRSLVPTGVVEEILAGIEALPNAPASAPTGRVGDYRLLERIGAGGMGTVHLAEHVETGARYAVKTLPAFGDPEFAARFRREGEAQARVDRHPNVVGVHALGQDRGRLYLVLDLVQGSDLDARLEDGALPYQEAATLVRDLARGLAHVHAQGVLHRDIKPANVLVDETGTPKLVDFGLAKVAGEGDLTQTGTILGTPSYMAPEQVEGLREAISERTDVYGLGALLYHCLTGEPPFKGNSALAIMSQVARDEPPPVRNLNPDVPAPLEAICHRALSKDPARRQPSAQALADALEAALGASVSAPRRPLRLLALTLAPLAALASLALVLSTAPAQPGVSAEPAPLPPANAPEPKLSKLDGVPSWPLSWRDAGQPEVAKALYRRFLTAKQAGSVDAAACSALRQAADLNHPQALRDLGQLQLLGSFPRFVPYRPGLGVYALQRAVRFGGPQAALDLALVHGLLPAGVEGLTSHARHTRGLALPQDKRLAAALTRIAHERVKNHDATVGLLHSLAEQGIEVPDLSDAWGIVREAYEPIEITRALTLAERALDALERQADPGERGRLLAQSKQDGFGLTADAARDSGSLSGLVFLLRRELRKNGSPIAERELGKLLLGGGAGPGAGPGAALHTAGLWRLWQLVLQEDRHAMQDMAQIYAHGKEAYQGLVPPDLAVAGAYCFLAERDGEKLTAEHLAWLRVIHGKLPPYPATELQAWRLIRAALPWAKGGGN